MKRLFSILVIAAVMVLGAGNLNAANDVNTLPGTIVNFVQDEEAAAAADEAEEETLGFHQELKKRFIEGGPSFMGIVLLCLILGLAVAIERIIFLNLSDIYNTPQNNISTAKFFHTLSINNIY